MQKSIKHDLSIGIGVVILCVSVLIGIIYYSFSVRSAENEFKNSIARQTKNISDTFTLQLWLFDLYTTRELCKLLLDSPQISGLRLLDHNKEVIFQGGRIAEDKDVRISKELRYEGTKLVGHLDIFFTNISWQQQRRNSLVAGGWMVLGAILASFLFINLLLKRYLSTPLGNLQNNMVLLAEGGFQQSTLVDQKTEIQNIIDAFNNLTLRLRQRDQEVARKTEILEQEVAERKRVEKSLQKAHAELEKRVKERTEELATANIRLLELDRLKSMFIASMSHELRTPLNSILGFTSIILDGMSGELNSRQEDQLNRVHRSARHLLAMINEIIDISKIEAGRVEVFPEEFALGEILDEASGSIQIQLREKGLNFEVNAPFELQMNTDRKRLLQCILNLLSNAVKFTETGTVELTAREIDKELEIAVSDTGIGIAEKDMPKVFKPFERIETRLKVKAGGTGLGLYLTNKIATELLGGTIELESEEGKGSTFRLRVPKDIKYKTFLEDHGIPGTAWSNGSGD